MNLPDLEIRVLGALVEKERTTPDAYPLSTNSLVAACNQSTNRDPVTDHGQREVEEALTRLRERGLVETRHEAGARVPKHRHRLDEALGVTREEMAVLAVLMLRGAQTPGELRTRTERYVSFREVASVGSVLERLAERSPALVENRGRGPGQSQDRWAHLLGGAPDRFRARVRGPDGEVRPAAAAPAQPSAGTTLHERVAALEAKVERLMAHLGLQDDDPVEDRANERD